MVSVDSSCTRRVMCASESRSAPDRNVCVSDTADAAPFPSKAEGSCRTRRTRDLISYTLHIHS